MTNNRVIKFRCWDLIRSKMLHAEDCLSMCSQGKYWEYADNVHLINNRYDQPQFVLMQYIGLRDKNDKEIFEGDLCTDRVGEIVKIFYDNKLARFQQASIEDETYLDDLDTDEVSHFKVIGNIYQNPDLTWNEEK